MTTLLDLRTYCQDFWGDKSSTKALRVFDRIVNQAHREIAQANRWSYFLAQGYITMRAPFSTGTVAITQYSKTLTLTGGTWPAAALVEENYVILDADTQIELQIEKRESDTVLTLKGEWPNADVTAGAYNLYFANYPLPADFRNMDDGDLEDQNWISYLDPTHFRQYKLSTRNTIGQELFYTIYGNRRVLVYPYPEIDELWQFDYYRWPRDLEIDSDDMDWDERLKDVMFAAIDMLSAKKRKDYFISYGDAYTVFNEKVRDARSVDSSRQILKTHWRLRTTPFPVGLTPREINRGTFS